MDIILCIMTHIIVLLIHNLTLYYDLLQHDPETHVCSPGQPYGNFIMYARATSGDKPNNNQFSRCSQSSMGEIMAVKARGNSGCFTR